MFQKVYPSDIPELEPYKGIVKDDLDTLLGDIVPYDLFYYYSNQYIMRYVNNYYNYVANKYANNSPQKFTYVILPFYKVFSQVNKQNLINLI